MAYYSNFHHSNHPNFKQPYGQRPHRSPRSSDHTSSGSGYPSSMDGGPSGYGGGGDHLGQYGGGGGHMMGGGGGGSRYQNGGGGGGGGGGDRSSSGNTLWMGNIDESMDEQFISYAFNSVGVNVQNIKIIRNKDTGLPVGYGFITFDDRNTAQNVLRELNGKKIPNLEDDKRFFLKPANRQSGGGGGGGGERIGGGGGAPGGPGGSPQAGGQRLSIFVGNLPPEIDDEILMSAFLAYYPSTASAKVITADGQSKGFGFVAFEDEYDYQTALSNPNMMLGQSPISISRARHSNPGGNKPRGGGGGGGGAGGYNNGGGDNMRSRRPY